MTITAKLFRCIFSLLTLGFTTTLAARGGGSASEEDSNGWCSAGKGLNLPLL